ncbi:MAG TPA: type II toxin-antitoxin system VapC family toxin [Acetobacteraceae bacterium]|nr:type II toxin-antitoxin system VapC family toxin [Acetobacteraceae bacterium]
MNLLLDTHVFLWWDRQDKALNADTRALIADPANQVFISAASIWEIAIKRRLKKLDFRGSAVAAIGANGFHELPILPIDAENAGALAWHHNDPFDRVLVAQARRLTFTLATADAAIRAYPNVAQMWAS